MKSVIYSIYGKDIAENIIEVNYDYEDIKITGVIGKPVIARSNRSNQLFFVNKRYIKDKTLTSAAEQGYKGLLTIGKYGFLVLNMEMNPQKVDVNVHPAKLEVRFEDENKVFKAIYHTIKDSLLKEDLIPDKTKTEFEKQLKEQNSWKLNSDYSYNDSYINNLNSVNTDVKKQETDAEKEFDILAEINKIKNAPIPNVVDLLGNNEDEKKDKIENDVTDRENFISQIYHKYEDNKNQNENIDETKKVDLSLINDKMKELEDLKIEPDYKNFDEMYARTFGTTLKEETKIEEENKEYRVTDKDLKTTENISIFEKLPENEIPTYKYIGIAFSTYIIIEMDGELYIIDQHAAHERIMYEKIKANYYSDNNKDSQLMLLPDIINLSHKDMQIAKDNMEIFEKAGFMVEEFGENTIKLSGVPTVCLDLDTKELFLETLDEINTVARTAKQEIEEKFIATVACKAAVKANMALTKEEVDNLMKQLLVLQNPFTCPHGRPTAIRMTKTDIEKKFSRR